MYEPKVEPGKKQCDGCKVSFPTDEQASKMKYPAAIWFYTWTGNIRRRLCPICFKKEQDDLAAYDALSIKPDAKKKKVGVQV